APGSHQVAEVIESARVVVRRADGVDLPLPFQLLEHAELRRPIDEVVNLVNLDAAEQAQRVVRLLPTLRRAAGPDFGGDHRLISPPLEGLGQHLLRPAVPGPPAHASGALVPYERLRRSSTELQRSAR